MSDNIQTGFEVGGGLNIELGPKFFDQFIEAAMWQEWDKDSAATNIDVASMSITTAGVFTAVADDPFENIAEGQFFQITGLLTTDIPNNAIYQVKTKTSDLVVAVDPLLYTDLVATTAKACRINASRVKNPKDADESKKISFWIEKAMEDVTPSQFLTYSGCMVNSMSISAQSSSILTGSFEFMGQTSEIKQATGSTGDKIDSFGENILNAVSHVGNIRMDGKNINVKSGSDGVYFQSLDFTISNNLRGVQAIGQMGNVSVSPGQLSVSGNMNTYFQDATMYDYFVSGDEFSLSYEVIDANHEGYVFYFPRVTVSSSTMSAGGSDQDLVENMTWSALMDKDSKTSIEINRFYADYTDAPA